MRLRHALVLLLLGPACAKTAPAPRVEASRHLEPAAIRVVASLESEWREPNAFGSRNWEILTTSPPLIFSRREFLDARTGATVWTWRDEKLPDAVRAIGEGRTVAFGTSDDTGAVRTADLAIVDVARGLETMRHPLGRAWFIHVGQRGVTTRAAPERPLTFTTWGGRTVTLPWTGAVDAIQEDADTIFLRTSAIGRPEIHAFDARTGVPVSVPAMRDERPEIVVEQEGARWRLVRRDRASSYTSMWAVPKIIHATTEEIVVSALQCVDRGDLQNGRILIFDGNLKLRRELTMPAWPFSLVERTPTALRALVQGNEQTCPEENPSLWRHARRVQPMLIEIAM